VVDPRECVGVADSVEKLLAAFPGAEVLPELPRVVASGPVLACVHCGKMCVTHVEGAHKVWRNTRGAHHPEGAAPYVFYESPTTPLHVRCMSDHVAGRGHSSSDRAGAYGRRPID
jgi:hypothetical protein